MGTTRIFHSVNRWLPVTAGWIRDQIHLFDHSNQMVLADQSVGAHQEVFPVIFKKQHNGLIKSFFGDFRKKAIAEHTDSPNVLWSHFGNRAWNDLNLPCDKRIVRFYGYDLHRLPKKEPIWLDRYFELFSKADLMICEGPFMKEALTGMGCPEEKVSVLPIGVTTSSFIRRQIGQKLNILIVGAFKEKKGIVPALQACGQFIHQNKDLDVTIHLVGDEINATENDRKYAEQVRHEMSKDRFKNSLVFHSIIDRQQLLKLAHACHFAVLPSQWAADGDCEGGYPITLLDLMSTGLPIISTRHCDIPFVINEGNGILCDEGQVDQLVQAMENFKNPKLLEDKSAGAFETIAEHFDWSILKSTYHQIILGT